MAKPHVLCVPGLSQSHIGAMLKEAKILHHKGFFVTFVNSEFNHRRMLSSGGLDSLDSLPDWSFVFVPDGLPPSDADDTQDMHALCDSVRNLMVGPFSDLVDDLNRREGVPPITCILSDGFMNFVAFPAAEKVGVPLMHLFTISACALLALKHHRSFLERCRTMSMDDVSRSERIIDWIPGMKSMRSYFSAMKSRKAYVIGNL